MQTLQDVLIVGTGDTEVVVVEADRCVDGEDGVLLREGHELAQRTEVLHGVGALGRNRYVFVRDELLAGDLAGDAVLITCVVIGLSVWAHEVGGIVYIDLAVCSLADDINALVLFHGEGIGGLEVDDRVGVRLGGGDLTSKEYEGDVITGEQELGELCGVGHGVGAVGNEYAAVITFIDFFLYPVEKHFVHRGREVFGVYIDRFDDREILAELTGRIQHSEGRSAEFQCFSRKTGGNAAACEYHQDLLQICHVSYLQSSRVKLRQNPSAESMSFYNSIIAQYFFICLL